MNGELNKGKPYTASFWYPPAVYRIPSTSSGGYAFVVLIMAMTVMLIALAAALPSVYHESQREKEEELIFRGNEYARAIYLFQRQFQRYPKSVDELIRTNNLRFLRHAYKDPMNSKGKWRFIHVAQGGILIDSLTMGPQAQPQMVGASGTGQSPSNSSQSSQSSFNSGLNSDATGGAGPQQPLNNQSQSSADSGQGQGEQTKQDAQKDRKEKILAACENNKSQSAFLLADDQSLGTLIAGVASCSNKSSIRVWNKKTKYQEWEFLGTAFQPSAFPGVPQPPQQPLNGAGGQTTQPGQGIGIGQGGVGTAGSGPTPPGVQQPQNPPQPPPQNPPESPPTDQPPPDQDVPEAPETPPR